MSLEKAIEENTKALYNLIDALGARLPGISRISEEPNAFTDVKVEASTAIADIPKASTKPKKIKDKLELPEVNSQDVLYADVKNLVLELATNNRDKVKAIFAEHGFSSLGDLLVERDNPDGGVNNQAKLNLVYSELKEINNGAE